VIHSTPLVRLGHRAASLLRSPTLAGQGYAAGFVALAYFSAASIALKLAIPPGYASAVWPPAGIALAGLLLLGPRSWPGIWLGAVLANAGVVGTSLFTASAIGVGNTAEALAAAWLLRRLGMAQLRFDRPAQPWLFGAAACASAALAATGGVLTLALRGRIPWHDFAIQWGTWWLGDAAAIITVTPLIVTWCRPRVDGASRAKGSEAALFAAVLVLGSALIEFPERALRDSLDVLAYVLIPLITWAATRFDMRAVTAASFSLAAVATVDLLDGGAALFEPLALTQSLMLTLLVVSLVSLMGLTLASVVLELRVGPPPPAAPPAWSAPPAFRLTQRELDVLRLVASGMTNAEVGRLLHLSPRSVETYRARLMHKLGLRSVADLVKYAIRQHIVPLE
jgi:integral membrane sensor domain MASE1/DNA-binding CsgD family transcriptional regulator